MINNIPNYGRDQVKTVTRKFDSSINRKTLAGSIKPVFFLSNFMHIIVAIYSYMLYNRGRRYLP